MQKQKKIFRVKHHDFFITVFVISTLFMDIKLIYGLSGGIFDRYNSPTDQNVVPNVICLLCLIRLVVGFRQLSLL